MKKAIFAVILGLAGGVLLSGAPFFVAGLPYANAQAAGGQADNNIRAEASNALKKSEFKGVQVSVRNGVVDLEGTVKDFATKEEADKRVHRIKDVAAVRNKLQVAGGGQVPDQQLQQQIIQKLQYDRVFYGNAFNAISVSVQNGVVILSGHALGPVAADSAVSLASHFPGVEDVVDNIQVDPLSPMDDQLRFRLYRAIYGAPSLNQYAMDPAQPIRITVLNGHVELNGVVRTQADKTVAGIRANGVPGVFSVTNNLQVANQPSEKK